MKGPPSDGKFIGLAPGVEDQWLGNPKDMEISRPPFPNYCHLSPTFSMVARHPQTQSVQRCSVEPWTVPTLGRRLGLGRARNGGQFTRNNWDL
eukprot:s4718_g2.t1